VDITEQRVPGPTPSGGAYGIVRYLDARGRETTAERATALEFHEFTADGELIAKTSADLPALHEKRAS